jgi:hypothetical protein
MHMQKENMTTRLVGPDPLSFLPERQMHTVICEGANTIHYVRNILFIEYCSNQSEPFIFNQMVERGGRQRYYSTLSFPQKVEDTRPILTARLVDCLATRSCYLLVVLRTVF